MIRRIVNRIFAIEEISGDGLCPTYLFRWTLFRLGWFAIYVHKFVGDDWSLDLHDHPKRFISIGLRGEYFEWTPCGRTDRVPHNHCRRWIAPWFRTFPAEHIHRLTGPTRERPCWTLVVVLRAVRPWGFWNEGRWIHWSRYVDSVRAIDRRSCQ